MIRTVIIGSGAVAEGLARQMAGSGDVELVQIWARNPGRGRQLSSETGAPWTDSPSELATADLYVIAVSDGAVAGVSAGLPFPAGGVVAHTGGCVAMDELSPRIVRRAVLYPLQSFTRGRPIDDFRRIPFFIEGETPLALSTVRAAAEALSDNVTEMDSARRAHIHLAGAFANNFSNAMLSLAELIAADADQTFDCLRPLVAETLAKALAMPSPRMAQTGAAARGDQTVQRRHLEMLAAGHPELTRLYEDTSDIIWRISKKS